MSHSPQDQAPPSQLLETLTDESSKAPDQTSARAMFAKIHASDGFTVQAALEAFGLRSTTGQ